MSEMFFFILIPAAPVAAVPVINKQKDPGVRPTFKNFLFNR